MEVSLTFRGDSYEDREEMDTLFRSKDIYCALGDARQFVRNRLKHGESVSEIEEHTLETLNEILWVEGLDI